MYIREEFNVISVFQSSGQLTLAGLADQSKQKQQSDPWGAPTSKPASDPWGAPLPAPPSIYFLNLFSIFF